MVLFELIMIIFFTVALHDVIRGNFLTKYSKKYNGKTMDYIKEKEEHLAPLLIVYFIWIFLEMILLIYLAAKQYLFPFSLIVLIIYLIATLRAFFSNKTAKEKEILRYPSWPKRLLFKVINIVFVVFYGAMLYKLFVG